MERGVVETGRSCMLYRIGVTLCRVNQYMVPDLPPGLEMTCNCNGLMCMEKLEVRVNAGEWK